MRKIAKPLLIIITLSILASMFTLSASASGKKAYGAATVAGPGLNLRSGPDTTQTILKTLNEGDIIVILERTNSEWFYINHQGVIGYVKVEFLRDILVAENFNAQGRVTGDKVNIRAKPDYESEHLGTYNRGTVMTVIGINNGWYKVKHDGKTGYLRSDYMEIVSGQSASSGAGSSNTSPGSAVSHPLPPAPNPNIELGQQIAEYALQFLGYSYVYGGASPSGFDCSGFVSYVYKQFGIQITRTASSQYNNDGVRIAKSDLVAGDLVYFSSNGGASITHVGMYIGDSEFVHASTPSAGVIISRLDSTYYMNVWYGAVRIVSA